MNLRWNDKGQQKDIEGYLRYSATHDKRIAQVLDMGKTSIDIDNFVEKLKRASQGNFKYVEYILESIGSKEIGIEDIDSIPQGLQTYYDQIWNNIKQSGNADGWQEWDGLFRPVIALLAAASEPVSVQWLADITGKNFIEIRERAIDKWQRFLTKEVHDDKETWRVIHKSFADFIEDKIDLSTAHKMIINYYYDYAERWHSHQNYALRQLSAHLFEVNDFEKLSKLIDNQDWYKVQVEADPSASSYMQDVDRLSLLYEKIDSANLKHKKTLKIIGNEVKCALINGSLCTISSSITPTVLKALIQYEYWSPEQVLNVVSQISEDSDKEAAISEVAEYIPADLFDDVLNIVNGIISEESKVDALRNLLPYVPKNYNRKLVEIVYGLRDYQIHCQILHSVVSSLTLADFENILNRLSDDKRMIPLGEDVKTIAPYLKEDLLSRALELTRKEKDITAYAGLLPYLDGLKQEIVQEALTIVRSFGKKPTNLWGTYNRIKGLAEIAAFLPPQDAHNILTEAWKAYELYGDSPFYPEQYVILGFLKSGFVKEALEKTLLLKEKYDKQRDNVLVRMALELINSGKAIEALEIIKNIHESGYKDYALREIVLAAVKNNDCDQALKVWGLIEDVWYRMEVLSEIAAKLDNQHLEYVLLTALNLKDHENARRKAIGSIVNYLSIEQLRQIIENSLSWDEDSKEAAICVVAPRLAKHGFIDEAWALLKQFSNSPYYADTLAEMGSYLSSTQLKQAVEVANRNKHLPQKVKLLAKIGIHLPEEDRRDVLMKAYSFANQISKDSVEDKDREEALNELAPLLVQFGYPRLAHEAICRFDDHWLVVETFNSLLPYASSECRKKSAECLFEYAIHLEAIDALADTLGMLGPYLSQDMLNDAIDEAIFIDWADERAGALYGLVGHLKNKAYKEKMLWKTIETVKEIDIFYIAPDLVALFQHFTKEQLKALQDVIEAKGDEYDQAEFIAELLPYLSKAEQTTSIKKAFSLIDKTKREDKTELLSKLIPFSSGKKRRTFIQHIVKKLLNENSLLHFDEIVPRIGQYLSRKQCKALLEHIWQREKADLHKAAAIVALVPYLTEKLLDDARSLIFSLNEQSNNLFAYALAGLALSTKSQDKTALLSQATEAISQLDEPFSRRDAIKQLESYFLFLPRAELYKTYNMIMRPLMKVSREIVLQHLRVLPPIINKLGGKQAIDRALESMIDVIERW